MTLHPRRILHAAGAISVHGGFSPGEPRALALRSGAEYYTDWATEAPKFSRKNIVLYNRGYLKQSYKNHLYDNL